MVASITCFSAFSRPLFGDYIALGHKTSCKVRIEIHSKKTRITFPHSSTVDAEPNNIITYNNL